MVIDTDILVDHFRGIQEATDYLDGIPPAERVITDVTVMELHGGATNRQDAEAIDRFVDDSQFTVLSVTATASRRSAAPIRQFSLSHNLGIVDALIAAIVLEAGGGLVTANARHFDFLPGLQVAVPEYRRELARQQAEGIAAEA